MIMKGESIVYNEVLCVLSQMDEDEVSKIPKEVIEKFRNNTNDEYIAKYDSSKSLDEQGYQIETLETLAMLNLNYLCDNDEEKVRLINKYKQNEIEIENEKRIKYNSDNIFVNSNEFKNKEIVEYHEKSFFSKFFNFIKRKLKNRGENI